MYIKSIQIKGFRNFVDNVVEFKEGVNVIIGQNNAGKTNLLKALSLILDTRCEKKLEIDDLNKHILFCDLQVKPPRVTISLTIAQSENEDLMGDDLVTVAPWLTSLQSPYEAVLTYDYFLPESEHQSYLDQITAVSDKKSAWLVIKNNFLRKYIHRIYGGNPSLKSVADTDALKKFDYQFLHAIRDVERDMLTGRNSLLRDVIDFFMDYETKIDTAKDKAEKIRSIATFKSTFSTDAQLLVQQLKSRMKKGQEHIMSYALDTGASFEGATPDFDGEFSEVELYSALKLIISYQSGIEIPATHNGLGYNNLIYMSLLLAKMQVDTNGDYLGSNAKVFPVLVIEEPEAHLHPSLQYKFLKFLHGNTNQKARQIFISTHSTNITAAVGLDQIICLHSDMTGNPRVGYPGRVFTLDPEGQKSKNYVQRFLDATRSNMLFAKNIILVEGLAEKLLLPTFAKYLGKDLDDSHTAVIEIGGRYFDHFLKLFDTSNEYSICKKVTCITDRDPTRKAIGANEFSKKCYPFEYGSEPTKYSYSSFVDNNLSLYATHDSIKFFTQDKELGKTLEYDLMFANPTCSLLLTQSVKNSSEILELFRYISDGYDVGKVLSDALLNNSTENKRIFNSLSLCSGPVWNKDNKMKSLIAARYLNSISKGGNALELSCSLEENLLLENPIEFIVPEYLKEAILWSCK